MSMVINIGGHSNAHMMNLKFECLNPKNVPDAVVAAYYKLLIEAARAEGKNPKFEKLTIEREKFLAASPQCRNCANIRIGRTAEDVNQCKEERTASSPQMQTNMKIKVNFRSPVFCPRRK